METYQFGTISVLSVLMLLHSSLDQVHSISHYRYRHAFDYLQTFGYLPTNENSVISRKQFAKAVKQLQVCKKNFLLYEKLIYKIIAIRNMDILK